MRTQTATPTPDRQPSLLTPSFLAGLVLVFFAYLALGASIPLLPRLTTGPLGGDEADVGRLSAVFSAAAILSRPFLSFVSRRGVRPLAVIGSVLVVLGGASMWRVPNLAVLSGSRVLVSAGEALVWTAGAVLCTAKAPPTRQAEAISLCSGGIFLGIGLGPLLTEPLVKAQRFDAAALVVVVLSALSLAVALRIRDSWAPVASERRGRFSARELFHPGALLPGLVLGVAITGWSAWSNFVALRADEVGLSSAAILFTAYSAVAIVLRVFGARIPERIGLLRCAAYSPAFIALGLFTISVMTTPLGLLVGAATLSIGVGFTFPALSAIALERLREPSERPILLSSVGLFFEIGAGMGGLVLGPIARNAGIPAAFRVGALISLGSLVALAILRQSLRREARENLSTAIAAEG